MDVETVHTRDEKGVQHTYRVVTIESSGDEYPHTFEVIAPGEHEYRGAGRPGDLEARDEPPETATEKLAAAFGDEGDA